VHPLGAHSDRKIEENSRQFLREGLLHAQRKSWEALEQIRENLKVGISEKEAIELATGIIKDLGSPRAWHRPNIRFGENTLKTFTERPDPQRLLREDDIYFVDIGPVWKLGDSDSIEYEGDVGDTYCLGEDPQKQKLAAAAKSLFEEACAYWRRQNPTGDGLYGWLKDAAQREGYELLADVDGHRIGDFPHHRHFKEGLTTVHFTPASDVWILEVQIVTPDRSYGAFYEDILH